MFSFYSAILQAGSLSVYRSMRLFVFERTEILLSNVEQRVMASYGRYAFAKAQ